MVGRHHRDGFDRHDVIGGHDLGERRGRQVRRVAAQIVVIGAHDHPKPGQRPAPLARGVCGHERDVDRHQLASGSRPHRLHERLNRLDPGRHGANAQYARKPGDGFEPAALGRHANADIRTRTALDLRAQRRERPIEDLQVRPRENAEHGKGERACGAGRLVENRIVRRGGFEPIRIGGRFGIDNTGPRGALHGAKVRAGRIAFRQRIDLHAGFRGHGLWWEHGLRRRIVDGSRLVGRHLGTGTAFPEGALQRALDDCLFGVNQGNLPGGFARQVKKPPHDPRENQQRHNNQQHDRFFIVYRQPLVVPPDNRNYWSGAEDRLSRPRP